ncbi:MAG TPA: YkgJ family cysteine cluster protein [Prosthecobacter sp.]
MNAETTAAASRLCTACGMCCDGTMFQIVRMQPGDSPAELGRLGMRIRSQGGEFHMEQPCAALVELRCRIYDKRPTRCRLFNCEQLFRLEAGTISEAEAAAAITETRGLVQLVRDLIEQSGLREDGQALAERYERLMSTPVNAALEPEMVPLREELERQMQLLRVILNRDFRVPAAQG